MPAPAVEAVITSAITSGGPSGQGALPSQPYGVEGPVSIAPGPPTSPAAALGRRPIPLPRQLRGKARPPR